MKLKGLFLHITALGIVLAFIMLSPLFLDFKKESTDYEEISGPVNPIRGVQSNYSAGKTAELQLTASLSTKNAITMMGSSEFGDLLNSSYYYLPDSLNIPTMGFGHAYHQHFSIFCELLAQQRHLKGANVCVVLSPGWLLTEGTNIEAFLEFVPKNYLSSILHNPSISERHKLIIADYVHAHYDGITSPNSLLKLMDNWSINQSIPVVNAWVTNQKWFIKDVRYNPVLSHKQLNNKSLPKNFSLQMKNEQQKFVASVHTNDMYVMDEYYTKYLTDNGKKVYTRAEYMPDAFKQMREIEDFKLVVEVLKLYGVNASFIIQPLNNYSLEGLHLFTPLLNEIRTVLKNNEIPYLDMFVVKRRDYEPGVLRDIMHLGDFGWMKINEFLVKTYQK